MRHDSHYGHNPFVSVAQPSRASASSRARQAAALFAFWSAVALLFASPRLVDRAHWQSTILASLAEWWSWGLMTPVVIVLHRRVSRALKRTWSQVLAQVAIGVLVTVAYVYVDTILSALMKVAPLPNLLDWHVLADAAQGIFLWAMVVYWLIFSAWSAYSNRRRALAAELSMERLERSFAEARLTALRLQLDPHFLFNALNTISAQLQSEPKLARRMIEHLGDLLRLSLDPKSRHDVPLSEELAFLDHYLAIQKIRFGEQLKIELSIAPEVLHAAVPSLFMQPLVENAIRHGISRRAEGGTVRITAARHDDTLDIRVVDDGVGLPAGWSLAHDAGLGLSVTRERILGLDSGSGRRFLVHARREGGTEIEIAIPYRTMEAPDARIPA